MKLYHATKIDNKEAILEFGLFANESDKISNDVRLDGEYVFGFNNLESAINFIEDNCEPCYIVFSFNVSDSDAIKDTEYVDADGDAYAVPFNISANMLTIEIEEY